MNVKFANPVNTSEIKNFAVIQNISDTYGLYFKCDVSAPANFISGIRGEPDFYDNIEKYFSGEPMYFWGIAITFPRDHKYTNIPRTWFESFPEYVTFEGEFYTFNPAPNPTKRQAFRYFYGCTDRIPLYTTVTTRTGQKEVYSFLSCAISIRSQGQDSEKNHAVALSRYDDKIFLFDDTRKFYITEKSCKED